MYGFIADLEAAGDAPSRNQDTVWSVADLQRFAQTPTATGVMIVKVLDVLMGKPDDYFATSQLEELTGVPRQPQRPFLRPDPAHQQALRRAGLDAGVSLSTELGADHPAEGHYRLMQEQADFWKQARAA